MNTLRSKYYETLTWILTRGELGLASLSLMPPAGDSKLPWKVYNKKVDMAASYELFIYKVLKFCIKHLNISGV